MAEPNCNGSEEHTKNEEEDSESVEQADPYNFEDDEKIVETEEEAEKRLASETRTFTKFRLAAKKNSVPVTPTMSGKKKLHQKVVNKRQLKACPICGKRNKQMSRHLRTVHANVSGKLLHESHLVSKIRSIKRRSTTGSSTVCCPICGCLRSKLKSHLIHEHRVPKPLLKSYIGKQEASPTVASNACVEEWVADYERVHFCSFDGAHRSEKEVTQKRTMRRKLTVVAKMLDFLVPKAQDESLEGALKATHELFVSPGGYVWTRTGKYSTLVRDIDAFREFCGYARREGLVDAIVATNAEDRLARARKNAKSRSMKESAQFQDKDRQLVVVQADLDAFQESPKAKQALADLEDSKDMRLDLRKAVTARNYLIARLLLDNSSRPSDLDGITLKQLEEAKKDPHEDDNGETYFSVTSLTSKNVTSSGLPTYLLITKKLMDCLDAFIQKARPTLANYASPPDIFLTQSGNKMTHELISHAYRSIWKATAKTNPEFKTAANSRHVRHSTNSLAKVCGSQELKDHCHIGLNHGRKANEQSYMSIIRPSLTLRSKTQILKLRKEESDKFESIIRGKGCTKRKVAKLDKRRKCPDTERAEVEREGQPTALESDNKVVHTKSGRRKKVPVRLDL